MSDIKRRVYTGRDNCHVATQPLKCVYTWRDKATVANNFNLVSDNHKPNGASV